MSIFRSSTWFLPGEGNGHTLGILVENFGRLNWEPNGLLDKDRKGLDVEKNKIMLGKQKLDKWTAYLLDFKKDFLDR